ncbi:MerR family transcriptional regulator [Paenibacillus ehimensis]|uniref:MerR family transcriptional regulator n=1 Tax=Paenibacillus ehimensis TaxID=79264 RepID=UPI000FD760E9|nr:MerR family transcriptional regulator [Paenibacillus ehimensis]
MKIQELARRLNVSTRAIRFYEEKGLLAPDKHPDNGYRRFTEEDAWRLQTILALREAGIAVDDIRTVLERTDRAETDEVRRYLELQRSALYGQWLELRETLALLDGMIERTEDEPESLRHRWHSLAERAKASKAIRDSWVDLWNFDALSEQWELNGSAGLAPHVPPEPVYSRILAQAAERVAPQPGEWGLDIGTGTGGFASRLLASGVRMIGIDQSAEMLRRCRMQLPALETRVGNLLSVPSFDGQFDFVVTSFAFHHLTEAQQPLALAEMARILKAKGRIAIVDWMDAPDGLYAASGTVPGDEHYAESGRLAAWFQAHGFRAETVSLDAASASVRLVLAVRPPS